MSSSEPFFSFVTATYNRANYLPELIRCMSRQTFSDFEIIVVDDGSTDNSLQILSSLAFKEPRLKIIQQENKERGAARNNGIRNAKGTYIVFADSDDTFESNHLEKLHEGIVRNGYPDFLCNRFDMVRDGKHFDSAINKLPAGWYDYRLLLDGNILGMYHAIKRENPGLVFFEEDRKYAILEDWMFNISNLRKSRIYLNDALTYHLHDHDSRSMRSDQAEIITRKFRALEWINRHVALSNEDTIRLSAHCEYFAAVHCQMDGRNSDSRKHLSAAFRMNGIRMKYVLLFLRSFAGKRLATLIANIKKK
ncbi:MAG: glycosyltransferase family 2 protein [Bacteroidota bacterium]